MDLPVTLDIVSCSADGSTYTVCLVEEGPWLADEVTDNIRRVQDRLYSALEAIGEGKLVDQFPESVGKPFILKLRCFNTPDLPVRTFFEWWAAHVQTDDSFAPFIASSPFIESVAFAYQHGTLARDD